MPGTTFLQEEDKMLVQTASKMSEQGTRRIAWKDVARKMKRWKRSPEDDTTRELTFQAQTMIFQRVARQKATYPGRPPHLNAGEILPRGVSSLIAAIQRVGPIRSTDVFVDIDSGVEMWLLSLHVRRLLEGVLELKYGVSWLIAPVTGLPELVVTLGVCDTQWVRSTRRVKQTLST
ncbi:hypothetical protein JG688_00010311 [Phytophthora aleatoria]|uniref:Myb-like domain-containing protein n=1 Tax=Phytophthora aleatoria TaxID=2496075 RepID=A0A8J5MF55_9STRA|nr:hypothetical protein JG688_00010311 [Phytophthora aleatoria]